ncbi:hypothetical protein LGQ02_14545 [Bacillus shivajii]|uniref:hypothetical protein n=1 Tax=Bacillus shivajii TaxID=1983719 RepID=UPI001CFB4785|nr:hypothetical protein [Bacillus shivajii]UCZ52059.1 hypothetical protein LGQ02_14545 [Bacillus shivajii]
MKKLIQFIGIGIFVGWAIALIVNFSIYQHTASMATLFHPIVDGILFMGIMLLLYFVIFVLYNRNSVTASIGLFVLGSVSIGIAAMLYF